MQRLNAALLDQHARPWVSFAQRLVHANALLKLPIPHLRMLHLPESQAAQLTDVLTPGLFSHSVSYTRLLSQNSWICGSRTTLFARMSNPVCGRFTVELYTPAAQEGRT